MSALAAPPKPRRKGELPRKLESLVEALTVGIRAAAKAPTGTVNVADYLSPAHIRTLAKLAEKAGQTPRQFLQATVGNIVKSIGKAG